MNQLPAARKHGSFRGRIGTAREDITPPVGIYSRNWDAAEHDTADSIHRPLTLTALTVTATSGGDPLVLVDADLALKDWPTADELERQRVACNDRTRKERLRRKRDIRRSLGDDAHFSMAVHVWRMGDAVLVGGAGKAYSQLQQELRCRFPQQPVICMNLVNGWVGYLPPAELYDMDVYPVWQTPFDRGCLEQVTKVMINAIEELQR